MDVGMMGSPGDGGDGGRRGDNFTGGGQLEGEVQHCLAITPGLQVEDCWTPLPPEVDGMAELMLDDIVGSCRPRASSRPRRCPGSSWSRHILELGEGTSPTPQSPL